MKRQRFVTLGLLLAAGAGCQSQGPLMDPSMMNVSHQQVAEAGQVARSQNPEKGDVKQTSDKKPDPSADKPIQIISFLDISPESVATEKEFVAARIRATVGKEPILDIEVQNYMKPKLEYLRQKGKSPAEIARASVDLFNETLEQLIDREVVVQSATKQLTTAGGETLRRLQEAAEKDFDRQLRQMRTTLNIKTDEEFNKWWINQGVSLEYMRRQREHEFIYREYLNYRIKPILDLEAGHQQILAYYKNHPEEFQVPDSVQWQDIFLYDYKLYPTAADARKFAEELAMRVRKGEDFGKLADKFDCGTSKGANGEGQGKLHGEIRPPEAEATLFKMNDGDMAVLVMPNGGCHLMRLVKRQHAGLLSPDAKVQKQIQEKLRMEIYPREAKRIVEELRRKVPIEIARNVD